MSHDIQKLSICYRRKFRINSELLVAFVVSVRVENNITTTVSHTVTLYTCTHFILSIQALMF